MSEPILDIREVSYHVGGREILRNVNLRVNQGETIVLLGRSGSGKTTLLRMINRLIEPTSGDIVLDGKPLAAWNPIRLRRGIGYVIQEGGLFPHRTVQQNIALVPRLEQRPPVKVSARVTSLMNTMGLHRNDTPPAIRDNSQGARSSASGSRARSRRIPGYCCLTNPSPR